MLQQQSPSCQDQREDAGSFSILDNAPPAATPSRKAGAPSSKPPPPPSHSLFYSRFAFRPYSTAAGGNVGDNHLDRGGQRASREGAGPAGHPQEAVGGVVVCRHHHRGRVAGEGGVFLEVREHEGGRERGTDRFW